MEEVPKARPEGVIPFEMSGGFTTWISWQDYDKVRGCGAWRPHVQSHTAYAIANYWRTHPTTGRKYRGTISMHRLITGDPPGLTVDHKNRDGLSNWRENLEAVPHGVNNSNREINKGVSGYWGVDVGKAGRFRARVTLYNPDGENERKYLGTFDTALEAAEVRDRAMIERYGLYVPLNFPADRYGYELPVTLPPVDIPF